MNYSSVDGMFCLVGSYYWGQFVSANEHNRGTKMLIPHCEHIHVI